jgi:biopolymer transport protein ExbB/TolQ
MTTTGFEHFWSQGDAITRSVATLLLLMSISAWVVIFWKGWLLRRVQVDLQRAVPAFWAAPSPPSIAKACSGRWSMRRSRHRRAAPSKRVATPTRS